MWFLRLTRIDEKVHEGDEEEQGEGVQVGDDIVGDTVSLHDGRLTDQVVVLYIMLDWILTWIHIHRLEFTVWL